MDIEALKSLHYEALRKRFYAKDFPNGSRDTLESVYWLGMSMAYAHIAMTLDDRALPELRQDLELMDRTPRSVVEMDED